MKYIVKNIRIFIKEEIMVFVLLCLSIICSVAVLHTAYGIYCAINRDMLDALYGSMELTIDFENSSSLSKDATKGKLLKAMEYMDPDIMNGLDNIILVGYFPEDGYERIPENEVNINIEYGEDGKIQEDTHGQIPNNDFYFNFRYKDGKIMCYEPLYDNLVEGNAWCSGSYFTGKQYEDGELVAVALANHGQGEPEWDEGDKYKPEDGYVMVDNKKYKVIGSAIGFYDTPLIPFISVSDDFVINWVTFMAKDAMKRREYEAIVNAIRVYFPDVEIPPYPVPDADETMVYKSIMVICVLIVVISALVYAVLYQYVIERRKRMLNIFRVSGLSLSSAQHIYMGECVLLLAVCYGAALVLFRYFLQPFLQGAYFYIGEVFSLKAYAILGAVYFAVVYLILRVKVWHSFQKARMIERI